MTLKEAFTQCCRFTETHFTNLEGNKEELQSVFSSFFELLPSYFSYIQKNEYTALLEEANIQWSLEINTPYSFYLTEDCEVNVYYHPKLIVERSLKDNLSILIASIELFLSEISPLYERDNEEQDKYNLRLLASLLRHRGNALLSTFSFQLDLNVTNLIKQFLDEINSTGNEPISQSKEEIILSVKSIKILEEICKDLPLNFSIYPYKDSAKNFSLRKQFEQKLFNEYSYLFRGRYSLTQFSETEAKEKEKVTWLKEIKQLLGTVPKGKRHTKTRLNRRQPLRADLSGTLSDRQANLIVAIDTSGSMNKEMCQKALNQIYTLKIKYNFEMTVFQCDCEIKAIHKIKTVKDLPTTFLGRGGTSFQPVIDYLNSHSFYRNSILIYFTDGEGETHITRPLVKKVLWILVPSPYHSNQKLSLEEPYGRIIKLPNK